MDGLERPPAVGRAVAPDDLDRLGHAVVGRDASLAKVLEAAEHVVEVPVRERELEPARVDHLAGRLAAEEPALEHVLLPTPARVRDPR
jgi:hypothetical protein